MLLMPIDQAKLKALKAQGSTKVGGQRVTASSKTPQQTSKAATEVMTAINRLGAKSVKVAESWMFHSDNTIQIFKNPKVLTTGQNNAWVIQGASTKKDMTSPDIMMQALSHMGMEQIGALQSMLGAMGGPAAAMGGMPGMPGLGGDEIPNFDEVDGEEAPDLV